MSSINLGSSVRLGLPNTKTVLKQSGVYKISRNPMYLGFNAVTLASMIYVSNWIVIILGVYSIIIYHYIILGEEKFLTDRFGEEYSSFKRNVHRYL
jgi:protein-S-isoprenylcysteine O-methyltransferase Ste14